MRALQRTLLSCNPHKTDARLQSRTFILRLRLQEKMPLLQCLLLLFTLHVAEGWDLLGEREKVLTVCVGKEFRLPVDSTSRIVTFTPDNNGPRQILLEKTTVKDPRFEWTRDKTLVLKEVTHSDQGLYANKLSIGFTYETVHLIVSECVKPYRKNYGESFEHSLPENGSVLEFSPWGALPEAEPVVLWNRTNLETGETGRGRLLRGGKAWVAERVTQADQGNYTVRDDNGKVVSRSTLSVRGHSFNITRFTKESLSLPLFLPVHHAHLIFTPGHLPDESSMGPFDPKPPRGPVQLLRDGHINDHDLRYRGLISLNRNGSVNEVVITRLTPRHDGLYEVRDKSGNLVSATYLHIIERRGGTWRALLKSITVPSGMFVSLAGFILFMKRYPNCSLSQIITGIRTNQTPPANPPRVNIQDYSHTHPHPAAYYSYPEHPETPRKWSPRASPAHTDYTPVMIGEPSSENQQVQQRTAEVSPRHDRSTEQSTMNENEEKISFPVAGATDCLHSSEDCAQYQIKKDGDEKRWSSEFFSTLPLDTDTSESCSVYTSEKLDFL
ncbi:uncharacterized protein LOC112153003 isoform X1 [Oryzias melastigma]|uniref:uncharacterized protein LOC112153003 isoform X1 n=2 Tax=Oryzias melastigma TaxID=30732 RepID=UPI000CF8165D|nr:uncharacterized protein LOC112153003 isoform X1 [Oryzias melastigma]